MLHAFSGVRIEAIRGASGAELIDVAKLCQEFMEEKKALRLVNSLGFKTVRQLAYPNTAGDLCGAATLKMFAELNIDPKTIDAFIFVTQNPDYMVPANTFVWQERLGLSSETVMLDLIQGCSGYVYGLFYASLLISSGLCKRVLLCAGDTSCDARNVSKMKQPANVALFGDGGSATLLCSDPEAQKSFYSVQSNGEMYNVIIGDKYSSKRFRSVDRDEEGNPQAPKGTFINGVTLASYAVENVKSDVVRLLDYCGRSADDISYFVMHQANKNLLRTLAMCLGVDNKKLPFLAESTGNTSSASIPLGLSEHLADLDELKVKPALLCGFGVGMSVASACVDLSRTQILSPVYL